MFKNKKLISAAVVVVAVALVAALAGPVLAQTADPGSGAGVLQNVKLGVVVQRVISAVLAIVGLLASIYLIYGGVLYLTSGGDTKAADKAKHVILSAIIGVIIIFVSWALVNYVMSALFGKTAGTDINNTFINQ